MIAGLILGRHVVVRTNSGLNNSRSTLSAHTCYIDGSRFETAYQITTDGLNQGPNPTVTGLINGDFVASWNSQSVNSHGIPIKSVNAQMLHADGVTGRPHHVGKTVAGNNTG